MSRFYIGFFAVMTLAVVAFAGVVIPQLSDQSLAKKHKDNNENNNHNNKLTICHRPPDNPDNYQTIIIKRSALQDHLSHGDLECACDPDGDGVLCDVDQCDNDPNKIEPGVCGCGVADTDSDGDGTLDCNEECDSDPNKTDPGQCGCGNPDTDTDQDTIADCNDQCPGQADDSDKDGYLSCVDDCDDNNPGVNPGVPLDNQCDGIDSDCSEGIGGCEPLCEFQQCFGRACREEVSDGCGGTFTCGVNIDNDEDGVNCLSDACDNDPDKIAPGACGCGTPDEDTDSDGTLDCNEECDNDPDKTEPGVCGCGAADTDTDNDGTADCNDGCDNDPGKTDPGACGCGTPDEDTDSDGTLDCNEECDNDPNKTEPEVCGCGIPEDLDDFDTDGTPACLDQCPFDMNKTEPGQCGCKNSESDRDGDNTADCIDGCPSDPEKTEPGCGCGIPDDDTDSDGDGTWDCVDGCVSDPNKTDPGQCGCGGPPDVDSDSDGTADCIDQCPGQADDVDGDGFLSCVDDCNDNDAGAHPGATEEDCNGQDDDCSGDCEPLCNNSLGCATAGVECGIIPDGCGGTVDCGTCSIVEDCILGQCCSPAAACALLPVQECGAIPDGCGGFIQCPQCPDGFTCTSQVGDRLFCKDPCGGCPDGQECDLSDPSNPQCVTDDDAPCVRQCLGELEDCGRDDGCGGFCTGCGDYDDMLCLFGDQTAPLANVLIAVRSGLGDGFCTPLCSRSLWECGPCLDCRGSTCVVSEKLCPAGSVCELQGGHFSTCVEQDTPTTCQEGCSTYETCIEETGKCACVDVDGFYEICAPATEICVMTASLIERKCCSRFAIGNLTGLCH
jgi:hypothetical protein